MEWKDATTLSDGAVRIPARWLNLEYYEALNILFRLENALRAFVYIIFKNEFFERWTEIGVTSDDAGEGTIGSIAKKRINQANSFGYLGYSSACPIMYLTSGELIRLITSDSYWKHFNNHFAATKAIVKLKLDEIGAIRNSLAHFRPIRQDDVDLLKQNAKQVLGRVEECLSEVIDCALVVPTNTEEVWYTEMKTLGTDYCTLSFRQSSNGEWLRLVISYGCPLLSQESFGPDYTIVRLLNLISPEALVQFPNLARLVTFASEHVTYRSTDDNETWRFEKLVSFTFGRAALVEHHEAIKRDLEGILLMISRETDLIQQDNLAKGNLVKVVYCTVEPLGNSNYRSPDTTTMYSPLSSTAPPEWWGHMDPYLSDFISGAQSYPWMPTTVSRWEAPF